MKLGRTLAWDEKAGRVTGGDEANRLLLRPYRNPWVHPAPANVWPADPCWDCCCARACSSSP